MRLRIRRRCQGRGRCSLLVRRVIPQRCGRIGLRLAAIIIAALLASQAAHAVCPDYAPAVNYGPGIGYQVAFGDFNRDNRRDLAFVNSQGVYVMLGNGDGTFAAATLISGGSFFTLAIGDVNGDGKPDLLVGGNDYGVPPVLGRYDASYGLVLSGMGDGRFAAVDLERSGVMIEGQVRHMGWLRRADGSRLIVVARNGDKLEVLRPRRSSRL